MAENATLAIDPTETTIAVSYQDRIESAIHSGIKLVLEKYPSENVQIAGVNATNSQAFSGYVVQIYRAMTAELLKELE
jgi:hypothetical protein